MGCHLFTGTGLYFGREACEELGIGGAGWRQGLLVSDSSSDALKGGEDKEGKEGGLEGSLGSAHGILPAGVLLALRPEDFDLQAQGGESQRLQAWLPSLVSVR